MSGLDEAQGGPGRFGRMWHRIRDLGVVRTALAPAQRLSLAFLTLGGFIIWTLALLVCGGGAARMDLGLFAFEA
ncbi:hypothetical protein, partial [Rhodovastum atsumiense]